MIILDLLRMNVTRSCTFIVNHFSIVPMSKPMASDYKYIRLTQIRLLETFDSQVLIQEGEHIHAHLFSLFENPNARAAWSPVPMGRTFLKN